MVNRMELLYGMDPLCGWCFGIGPAIRRVVNGLLTKTIKSQHLITLEDVESTVPSDLVVAYNTKMSAYDDAALEYNNRRIDALTATDSRAVHDWAINANIYRNKVRAALADWETAGHKNDYEKIAAFFNQIGRRDM